MLFVCVIVELPKETICILSTDVVVALLDSLVLLCLLLNTLIASIFPSVLSYIVRDDGKLPYDCTHRYKLAHQAFYRDAFISVFYSVLIHEFI